MGHFTIVHGYICGYDSPEGNRAIINALPEHDGKPYLTRDLFAVPAAEHSYWEHIITFGTLYNGVEACWEQWLTKFEALLDRLDCYEAHVYLITEVWGSYHYVWTLTDVSTSQEDSSVEPMLKWTFSGGPRSGIRESYIPLVELEDG